MTLKQAGALLKRLREKKGVSVKGLAKTISRSGSLIVHYEEGRQKPSVETARGIFDALEIHGDPRNKLIAIWGGGVLAKAAAWEKLKEE